jgi:hypothetical protein
VKDDATITDIVENEIKPILPMYFGDASTFASEAIGAASAASATGVVDESQVAVPELPAHVAMYAPQLTEPLANFDRAAAAYAQDRAAATKETRASGEDKRTLNEADRDVAYYQTWLGYVRQTTDALQRNGGVLSAHDVVQTVKRYEDQSTQLSNKQLKLWDRFIPDSKALLKAAQP